MFNPLVDEPVPEIISQRVHAFAWDLAYGAAEGLWSTEAIVMGTFMGEDWTIISEGEMSNTELLYSKWNGKFPYASLLVSLGYVQILKSDRNDDLHYVLTSKAFELLSRVAPASIFVSYRRCESSAFALLIKARFNLLGQEPFLDMNIEPGDDWETRIQNEIKRRENFICLLGAQTLESSYVRQEISWALDAQARVIPIWHNGFNDTHLAESCGRYPELGAFCRKNAIRVEQENPIGYETAIIQLMNRFGMMP